MGSDKKAKPAPKITMTRFIIEEQAKHPEASGDFTVLLSHIVLACKFIYSAVTKAGLTPFSGVAEGDGTQTEDQKKLENLADDVLTRALISSGRSKVIVTTLNEEPIIVDKRSRGRSTLTPRPRYCVVVDPLDGSSNVECGVNIGSIFGIYEPPEDANGNIPEGTVADVLQPGTKMVASGYCMYGSSCTFVLSTGNGVNGFTLDPGLGEFVLTHTNLTIPKTGKFYSVNEGHAQKWDEPTRKFVESCKFPKDGSPPRSLRYIGSMVADVHRTLLYGGVFMYPADEQSPHGKLRLLYEVFPMSFIIEQAGGQAFNGKLRALEVVPKAIHEPSPIFLGSYDDMDFVKSLYTAAA